MIKLTVEEFQEKFDEYMDRVENGESFILTHEGNEVVLMPVSDYEDFGSVAE